MPGGKPSPGGMPGIPGGRPRPGGIPPIGGRPRPGGIPGMPGGKPKPLIIYVIMVGAKKNCDDETTKNRSRNRRCRGRLTNTNRVAQLFTDTSPR